MHMRTMDIMVNKMKSLPGPRFRHQGPGSGEEFRDDHLIPVFDSTVKVNDILTMDMDGAPKGYPTSFLEEAFGGLASKRGTDLVKRTIRIQCTDEPLLIREIEHYIHYGEQKRTPPFVG